ncbi:MAG: hypothetical protein WBM02_06810 [bacterium]
MPKDQKTHQKKSFRRAEWIGVLLIFIIAVITGYFFMINRLEKAETRSPEQAQLILNSIDKGLDDSE